MAERDLVVRFIGDDKDLTRALTRSERKVKGFDSNLSKVGNGLSRGFAAAGIALGASAVFAATGRAISAASDLNEEISKSEQIFGASSNAIQAWADTTASAIGVSRTEALRATGTFGNLFRVVEIAPAAAGQMSQALVELAADLASFNNADPSDVLLAIRSGLIGEAEPLRRYGVLLSETRVQQEAMAATGKDNAKELTNQEKALARYNIILKDTAPAQGDFARTSGGLANQTRILHANLADLSATMGGAFLPAVNATVVALNNLIKTEQLVSNLQQEILKRVHESGVGYKESIPALQAYRDAIASIKGESDKLVVALDAVIAKQKELAKAQPPPVPLGPSADTQEAGATARQRQARDAQKAENELKASQKRFATLIKGLGLKLDKAGLTASTANDLAVLREIERAILRQIEVEGRTFELEQQLTDNRLKQAAITNQRVAKADKETKKAADKKKATGKTPAQKRIEEQFKILGLTAEGGKRSPSPGALRQRLGNLQEQIKGTVLDTDKTNAQLAGIAKVLKFKEVGKRIRDAILQMFNDISGALENGGKKIDGPQTAFTKLSAKNLLDGIGLSPEEANALRDRLSQVGPGGKIPTASSGGAFGFGTDKAGNIITVRVILDGKEISVNTTKHQQKQRGRGGGSRRGVRTGGV